MAFVLNTDDGEAFIRALYNTQWLALVLVYTTIFVWFVCGYFQGSFVRYPMVGIDAWFIDCRFSIDCFCAQC